MKKILIFCFLFILVTVAAQEPNLQKFVRPSKFQVAPAMLNESVLMTDTVTQKGKWDTKLKVDRDSKKIGFNAEKPNQTQSIRDEWLKRGGKVSYISVMLNGVFLSMDMGKLGKLNGYGGGYSFYVNNINLKIPEYKAGQSSWNSLNWGYGFDFVGNGLSNSLPLAGVGTMEMKTTIINMMFTGNVGWTWALGKFIDEGNWKGIALTLKYRPSINLTMTGTSTSMKPANSMIPDGTSSDVSGKLNAGGFGFDIDFTSLSATMNQLAPKPKSKISFFMLPPVGSNPLYISISYGLVFYPRAYTYKRIRL